jgi:hypothetical protein
MKKKILYPVLVLCACTLNALPFADFEDLLYASGNYENGANLTGTEGIQNLYGSDVTVRDSTFSSGSVTFGNEYNITWASWKKWAYSKDTDTVPNGYLNQYTAMPGVGAGGSTSYGLGYFTGSTLSVTFASAVDFSGLGMEIANTVYAYDSILNGDQFAAAFTTGDYYRVAVEGFVSGVSTGSTVHYLADYRSTNAADHYISAGWDFLDLDGLGIVDELQLTLETTNLNTPSYIAIDNLGVVPEPSASALLAGLLSCAAVYFRRRR